MHSAGLPVEVLIKYNGLVKQGNQTMAARKEILVEQRARLTARMEELQKTVDLLDHKISFYENALLETENDIFEMEV